MCEINSCVMAAPGLMRCGQPLTSKDFALEDVPHSDKNCYITSRPTLRCNGRNRVLMRMPKLLAAVELHR
jgi:hypothetical protein